MTSDADSPDEPKQGAKPREEFSVYSSVSGRAETFEDAREAGRAFFLADPAERPSVTHHDGNSTRTMARTEIHGLHPGGELKYFKSLPSSHAPDGAFREGFVEAMETSLTERLGQIAALKGSAHAARVDNRLVDDLGAFAYRAPEKAAQLWVGHSSEPPFGPVLRTVVDAFAIGLNRGAVDGRAADGETSPPSQKPSEHKLAANGSRVSRQSRDRER